MFNIGFTRKNKQAAVVNVIIDTGLDCDRPVLTLYWDCRQQYIAVLLQKYLTKQLKESIKNAHRLAYEQGYKDGRGKKKRKTFFSGIFTNNAVVY